MKKARTKLPRKFFLKAKAVIFDMDGVIIDSEKHHEQAHRQALGKFGINITKKYYIDHGVSREAKDFYREAYNSNGKEMSDIDFNKVYLLKNQLYEKIQNEKGIIPFGGAVNLVKLLFNRGDRLAVASTVEKNEVMRNLRKLDLVRYFSVIVAGGDFGLRKKPAPDIYLKTAQLLGLKPNECVAIEDSANGAKSAVSAGMTCLVVTNEYTKTHQFPHKSIRTSTYEIRKCI